MQKAGGDPDAASGAKQQATPPKAQAARLQPTLKSPPASMRPPEPAYPPPMSLLQPPETRVWVSVPSRFTGDMRISKEAVRVLRHEAKRDAQGAVPWTEFVNRWADHCQFALGDEFQRWDTAAKAVYALMTCSDKPRYRLFWPTASAVRMSRYIVFTDEWFEHMETPMGIRAIQGHSNRRGGTEVIDTEAIAVTQGFVPSIFHSTYKGYLQSIIQSGLYPGGLEAASRDHKYFSAW